MARPNDGRPGDLATPTRVAEVDAEKDEPECDDREIQAAETYSHGRHDHTDQHGGTPAPGSQIHIGSSRPHVELPAVPPRKTAVHAPTPMKKACPNET